MTDNGVGIHNRQAQFQMEFYQYFDSLPKWTVRQDPNDEMRLLASRKWHYPQGHRASLWAEGMLRSCDIQVHFSLPVSAGPELSSYGRRVKDVEDWIQDKVKILNVPLQISESPTFDEGMQVLQPVRDQGIYMLSCVFDVDMHGRNIMRNLVAKMLSQPVLRTAKLAGAI